MADGKLIFDTSIDTSGFDSGLESLDSKVNAGGFSIGKGLKSILGADIIRKAVEEVYGFGVTSLNTAAQVESVNKRIKSTYGESADAIFDFAKDAKKNYGMAETAALQYASVFGTFFKTAGLSEEEAAQRSIDLVGRAADLASKWGTTTEDALGKVYSALKGETEAINDFGIDVRTAALSSFVGWNMEGASQLDQLEAIYGKIMHDSADAEGYFAQTQESYLNQQRIWEANIAQTQAVVGSKLLPLANSVLTFFNSLFEVGEGEFTITDQLTDVTEQFEAFNTAAEAAAANFETTEATIAARAELAETYLTTLETLESKEIKTDEDIAAINNAVTALNTLYPDLKATMDPATGSLNMNTDAIRANIAALQDLALNNLFSEKREAAAARYAEAIYNLAAAEAALAEAQAPLAEVDRKIQGVGMVLQQLEDSGYTEIDSVAGEFAELIPAFDQYFTENLDGSWTAIDPASVNASDIITSAESALIGLNGERDLLVEGVSDAEAAVGGYRQAIDKALAEITEIDTIQSQVAQSMTAGGEQAASSTADGIEENASEASDAAGDMMEDAAAQNKLSDFMAAGAAAASAFAKGLKSVNMPKLKVTSSVGGTNNIDGSHASGLNYVPYNDYVARLHVGEAVLTASEARAWRSGEGASGGEPAPAYTAPHVTEINLNGHRIAEIQSYSNSAQIALDNQKIATGVGSR